MKKAELKKFKLLYGIREENKSFKLFKDTDNRYFVVKKQYILGIFKGRRFYTLKVLLKRRTILFRTQTIYTVFTLNKIILFSFICA